MSPAASPAVIFDCMTFLQATTRVAGPAAACLRQLESGRDRLVISQPILDEVRDVLSRPRIRKKNPHLTDESVERFLEHVVSLAPVSPIPAPAYSYPRDPKDEPYLNLAIAAGVPFLVSWDNDLLDLMQPDNADGQRLRTIAPDLAIVTPPRFLGIMSALEPSSLSTS